MQEEFTGNKFKVLWNKLISSVNFPTMIRYHELARWENVVRRAVHFS